VPQIWDVKNVLDVDHETIRDLDVEGAATQDVAASGDTSVAAADVVDHLAIVQ
jgi:hypothetical protein